MKHANANIKIMNQQKTVSISALGRTQKVFRFGGETAKMNVLEELIKRRNGVAERISEAIAERDAIGGQIGELQDELKELNDEVEATKDDEVQEAINREQEYLEVLRSGDYSALAREYRRLDKAICEGRKRGWSKPVISLHQQRRDVGDRMLEMVDL